MIIVGISYGYYKGTQQIGGSVNVPTLFYEIDLLDSLQYKEKHETINLIHQKIKPRLEAIEYAYTSTNWFDNIFLFLNQHSFSKDEMEKLESVYEPFIKK